MTTIPMTTQNGMKMTKRMTSNCPGIKIKFPLTLPEEELIDTPEFVKRRLDQVVLEMAALKMVYPKYVARIMVED